MKTTNKKPKTNKNRKGISLIVLVITIIVMIILAATIIISLNNNGIIKNANQAVDLSNQAQVNTLAQTIWADAYISGKRGTELVSVVEEQLEANGINGKNYTVEITDKGVSLEKFNINEWEFAYTYTRSNNTWSEKILGSEGTTPTGDIVAKFYKTGKMVTPAVIDFNGQEYAFEEDEAYKMIIQGQGEMGALAIFDDSYNPINANAWQLETLMYIMGASQTCIIPYVTEIVIDEGITNIGNGAFLGVESLTKLSIAESVENIGISAFCMAKNLTNIKLPQNLGNIGELAFSDCTNLITVTIAGDVENIGMAAFVRCTNLTTVTIQGELQNIGQAAFESCTNLTTVTIQGKLQKIGADTFNYCTNLTQVIVGAKEEWNNTVISRGNNELLDAKVTYEYRTKVERLANDGWKKAYDSGNKTQSALETAVTEYLIANEVSSQTLSLYNIEVTTTGVKITGKETTLGNAIVSGADYGKTINYSANGINEWKVLYKQTIENETTGQSEEYVYLIASENAPGSSLPTNLPGATINGKNIYWNTAPSVVASGTINVKRWLANWSNYSTNENGRCISYLLDENYWTAFKNTSKYGENIVGAIGTPTLEMIVASYNARSAAIGDTGENSTLTLTNGDNGYKINGDYVIGLSRLDKLYTPSYKSEENIWLGSPSDYGTSYLFSLYCNSDVGDFNHNYKYQGVRPVVCLKSNIPTSVGVTADNYDYILK